MELFNGLVVIENENYCGIIVINNENLLCFLSTLNKKF